MIEPRHRGGEEPATMQRPPLLAVSATFTAEPLEEALRTNTRGINHLAAPV